MNDLLICVAGKNNIAVDILQYLIQTKLDRYQLCVVCNRTEKGINGSQRSLRIYARDNSIPEVKLEELYGVENLIFFSLEYDRIINPEKFSSSRLFNIHFSLLPAYKGMYTSALPILHNEVLSGVTLHLIDQGIDTGDIVSQVSFNIENLNCEELYQKYIEEGTKLVLSNIENIIAGSEVSVPQNINNSSYFSKTSINYNKIDINLNQTARCIQNQIRAFSFREYQLPVVNGNMIMDSKITENRSWGRSGTIICETKEAIMLNSIDYNIILYKDRFDELMNACKIGDLSIVKEICSINRHVNQHEEHGWTPIIVATYYNQKEIVKYLLTCGADISVINNNGTNLLMYAMDTFLRFDDNSLVKLYLKMGLNPKKKDFYGHDLYYYMKEKGCCEENMFDK